MALVPADLEKYEVKEIIGKELHPILPLPY